MNESTWKSGLLIGIFLLMNAMVFGQGKSQITGTVVNASQGVIEYASVSLANKKSGKVLDGVITDAKGSFVLKNVAPGEYMVKIESVGFKPSSVSCVIPGSGNLGKIVLATASTALQEVTVTASKPLVETKLNKLVFNAANDVTSQSGVALDVLKKVPSISVDVDGNVELEGNSNIRFLINGKPSTIFGSSLADALQSIPASQIKSIEVIASPGARYDASGTGGIINIILKDSKVRGINGNVNVSAGTRLENGSMNLNVRRDHFGVSAFFSGNAQLNTTTLNKTYRQSYNAVRDTLNYLTQDGSSTFRRKGYQTGVNLDWDLSPNDKLTAGYNFNHFDNISSGLTNQLQSSVGAGNEYASQQSKRNSGNKNRENASDWSLLYHKDFKQKGQDLEFLGTYSTGRNFSDYYQRQDYDGGTVASSGSRGQSPGTDKEANFSLDYRQPLGKDVKLEMGAKAVFDRLNTEVVTDTLMGDGSYGRDANQTYAFIYRRSIYAGYVSTEFSAFHGWLEGQAGLRYEYTKTTADFKDTKIPSYGLLFPSIALSHKIDETQSFKAVWSYRIERPEYGELNPFYNITDPHNINTGNPLLRPEKGQRYELGYNKSFGGGSNIYIGATYRYNSDDIQPLSTYYPTLDIYGTTYTDVSLTRRFNIGTQTSIGGNIYGSVAIGKALSLRANIMFGDRTNKSPGLGSVSGFAFRGNLNASYRFSHDFVAEVFGNYNSTQQNIQGKRPAFYFYTFAMRKEFFNKKASLGLTATNPFGKYVDQTSTLFGSNFDQTTLRRVPYQSFGLTLSYKFGKLDFKRKEKDRSDEGPAPIEN